MSNNQSAVQPPAPAPSQPEQPLPVPPVPVAAAPADDPVTRLANVDIPEERRRLKAITDPSASQVMTELHGTTLDLVQDMARNQVDIRDTINALREWSHNYMSTLADGLEEVHGRIDAVEDFGGDTALLPDDAEVIAKCIVGCQVLAQQMLSGPFPIGERDAEGKEKLAELIALSEQAQRIITDATLSDDDDDDDEELPPTGAPNLPPSEPS